LFLPTAAAAEEATCNSSNSQQQLATATTVKQATRHITGAGRELGPDIDPRDSFTTDRMKALKYRSIPVSKYLSI